MAKKKMIIVGGGASGLIAGIVAARNDMKVTILERKNRIGKKILATGNGRCNLSNEHMTKARFHSDSLNIFDEVYEQFDLEQTIEFFRGIGIEVVALDEGKLYPMSLQASSVLNVLRHELERLKVNIVTDTEVQRVELEPKVIVHTNDKKYYGDVLIMATGGKSAPDLGSNGSGYNLVKQLGLTVIEPYPSLIQLVLDYGYLKHLKGTKVMANIAVAVHDQVYRLEYGEVLFTDYGISGPPVLQISRHASKAINRGVKDVVVTIDMMPKLDEDSLNSILLQRIEAMPYKKLSDFFEGLIPKQLIVPLIKDNQLNMDLQASNITKTDRQNIILWLKQLTLKVNGTRQWNQSQATAGGVDCTLVSSTTLRSLHHPNLYICGELLDIDGDCGGFNLQWAWSSGYVAALHASKE